MQKMENTGGDAKLIFLHIISVGVSVMPREMLYVKPQYTQHLNPTFKPNIETQH